MFFEGQEIGTYVLLRRLGRGGFGEVWLAEKRSQFVSKKVAVKLPLDDQVNFASISQEAQLWEQASGHPNVLPIIDADIIDGQVLIVSEFADGGSLADLIRRDGKLPILKSIELTIGILNGLEFLHSRQIIHRDIKPANVLLQGETPRLADFGISRAMNATAVSSAVIGTDAYMAPEAFDGKRSVRTDIWSVGVVLYALLADSLPFPQEHPSERLFAILTKDFEPLPDSCDPDLAAIVARALAKQPECRFASAAEMRDALQRVLLRLAHPTHAPTEVFRFDPPLPPPVARPDLPPNNDLTVPDFATQTPVTEVRTVVGSIPAPQFTPAPTQAARVPSLVPPEPAAPAIVSTPRDRIGHNLLIFAAGLTVLAAIMLITYGIRYAGSTGASDAKSEVSVDLTRDGELNLVISGTTPDRTFSDPAVTAGLDRTSLLAEIDSAGNVKFQRATVGGILQAQEFVSRLKSENASMKKLYLIAPQKIRKSLIVAFFKAIKDGGARDLTLFLTSNRFPDPRTPAANANTTLSPVGPTPAGPSNR